MPMGWTPACGQSVTHTHTDTLSLSSVHLRLTHTVTLEESGVNAELWNKTDQWEILFAPHTTVFVTTNPSEMLISVCLLWWVMVLTLCHKYKAELEHNLSITSIISLEMSLTGWLFFRSASDLCVVNVLFCVLSLCSELFPNWVAWIQRQLLI